MVAVGTLLLGLVVWLLWAPPTISKPWVAEKLECQSIGRGIGSDVSMLGAMSDDEAAFASAFADDDTSILGDEWKAQKRLDIQAAAARECSAARTNRLASLMLAVGVGLMWLVVEAAGAVIRRLPSR